MVLEIDPDEPGLLLFEMDFIPLLLRGFSSLMHVKVRRGGLADQMIVVNV